MYLYLYLYLYDDGDDDDEGDDDDGVCFVFLFTNHKLYNCYITQDFQLLENYVHRCLYINSYPTPLQS